MKKIIDEYKNEKGKIDWDQIVNHTIVYQTPEDSSGDFEILECSVVDTFVHEYFGDKGIVFLKINTKDGNKKWIKVHIAYILFVYENPQSERYNYCSKEER